MMLRRLLAGLLSTVAMSAVLAQPVGAQAAVPTPSLNLEHFAGATSHWEPRCNADGSGRIYWTDSGTATGPYTGTFAEAGYLSVGPADPVGGRTFQIFAVFGVKSTAPPAVIAGSKQFGPYTLFVTCQQFAAFGFFAIGMTYTATIWANNQTYQDWGNSNITHYPTSMAEDFFSNNGPIVYPSPGDGGGGDNAFRANTGLGARAGLPTTT
jgi:hypothetical protein